MSTHHAPSRHDCPSCVTGKGSHWVKEGEIVAIKNPNACNDNPDCHCGCHTLWAELKERHVPIGRVT